LITFLAAGDAALIIKAGSGISLETHRLVRALLKIAEQEQLEGVLDLIPSYNELMICYDPLKTEFRALLDRLKHLAKDVGAVEMPPSRLIEVPVLYGGDCGPDLGEVAARTGFTAEEVIAIHSAPDYLVYMLGFTPGFSYLGGMDRRIAVPRKETPRLKIPPGSVGIAEAQTGIYPVESPGGWQLIGRTPLKPFDPGRSEEFLFGIGDTLRFVAVTAARYRDLGGE
jgi:KipI family sensor histidine kinase inhibitor